MKPETVAKSFATYRESVLPANAPEIQITECRRAFYAGAYFVLMGIMLNLTEPSTSDDEAGEALVDLKRELEDFAAAGGMPLPRPLSPHSANED